MGKMKFGCAFVLLLVLELSLVCCQYAQSPCPGTFDYERDDTGIYGRIVIRPGSPVSRLDLEANFTVTVQILSNYYGRLELENDKYALSDYNQGTPMRYRVHFPVTSPLPRITWLAVNGQTVCSGPGDVLWQNNYLTTLNLRHTSVIGGGGVSPVFVRPAPQPQANLVNNFNNDPVYSVTPVRPPGRRPLRPPQQQPIEPIYVEPVTQAVRPQKPTQQIYYPEEPVTQTTPRPVRPRPVQSPTSSSNEDCGVVSGSIPLIVQGTPYNRGDIPWLVAIYRNNKNNLAFICGGTLVSYKHVVTAAHCMFLVSVETPYKDIKVKLGIYDLGAWEDDFVIKRNVVAATKHENYNASTLANDILILTLEKPVEFNDYIRPACLWSGDTSLKRVLKHKGTVAGWGEKANGDTTLGIPNLVEMSIVQTETCRASDVAFHQLTSGTTLCAGDLDGSGPCRGDSGGGLYIQTANKWRLRGIVSLSLRSQERTCDLNKYVIFTDAAQFTPWIRQIMQA